MKYKKSTEKIKLLKQEFKQYLIYLYPNISKRTIMTYLGDAFYVYRHNSEFKIDFFDLFVNKQHIIDFEFELLKQQMSRVNIIKPKSSTKAYINGLNRLFMFFNDKYGGVNNFINQKILQ
ncbi:MAG: hypothetical protein ACI4S3_04075 [Candidatus Gastranaerophilaceae bacterium]